MPRSWIRALFAHPTARRNRKAPPRTRLLVEALEHRWVPATTILAESAGALTLHGAELTATVNPNGSTANVHFQVSTYPGFTATAAGNIGSGFITPYGVAVDAAGDVFVADTGRGNVTEVHAGGTMTQAGGGFNNPYGVAVDAAGDVFVADTDDNAVKEVLANGTIQTIGSGLSYPFGVAVDGAGDVFVADTFNNAVKEVLANGTIQTIGSGFSGPQGVAVDGAGDVFVADTASSAVKEVLANGTILTIGSGFGNPSGVAVDGVGDVFVADTFNHAVKEVLANGTILTLGGGFSALYGVAVDAAGDVFVADTFNSRVVELSPAAVAAAPSSATGSTGTAVSGTLTGLAAHTTYYYRAIASGPGGTVAGPTQSFTTATPPTVTTGAAGNVTVNAATLAGTVNPNGGTANVAFQFSTSANFTPTVVAGNIGGGFNYPKGVAADAAGDVFVADSSNNEVKEVLADGAIRTVGSGFSGPKGVAVNAAGDVFVADSSNNEVKEVLANGTIRTIGSGFSYPSGVAVDAAGDVFVADELNSVVKEVLANGTILTVGFGFSNPTGVAVDAAGDVFVADYGNSDVKEVLANGTILTLGSGFNNLEGVAADAAGDVFVADYSNSVVKEVLANGTILTVGSGFNHPSGVAVDAAGDVFVADTNNNRVVGLSVPAVAAAPSPVTGSSAATVAGNLTSLAPGTTYYYRTVSTGPGGTVAGPTQSFTTQATPVVSAGYGNITYGTALSDGSLSGTANATVNGNTVAVPGTFAFTTADRTVPAAGTDTEAVTFTPTDTANYATASGTVSVNVTLPAVQFAIANETVAATAGTFTLAVTLSAVPAAAVTVPYTLGGTAAAGVDYAGLTAGTVVIPAGCTTANITGTVVDEGPYGDTAAKTLTVTLVRPATPRSGRPPPTR